MKQLLFSLYLAGSGLLLGCQSSPDGPQQVSGLPTLSEVDKQPVAAASLPPFVGQAHALADSTAKDEMAVVYQSYATALDEWFASSKRPDEVKQDGRFLQAASLLTAVMRQIPQTYRLVDALPQGSQRVAAGGELSQLAYDITKALSAISEGVTQLTDNGNQQLDMLGEYALAKEQQLATIRAHYGLTAPPAARL